MGMIWFIQAEKWDIYDIKMLQIKKEIYQFRGYRFYIKQIWCG